MYRYRDIPTFISSVDVDKRIDACLKNIFFNTRPNNKQIRLNEMQMYGFIGNLK